MEFLDLVKIGSVVKVNVSLSKDRLSPKTIEAINYSSNCLVEDFRLTDGKGFGVVVKLSNGEIEWFFENEIEILDSNGEIIPREQNDDNPLIFVKDLIKKIEYQPKRKVLELLNPLNFLKWLVFYLKDIF